LKKATSSKDAKKATVRVKALEGLRNKAKKKNLVLVRFYGDGSMTLVAPEKIKPFEKHFKEYAPNKQIWGRRYKEDEEGELSPADGSPMGEAQQVRFSYCMLCDKGVAEEEEAVGCNNCQAWTHIRCTTANRVPDEEYDFYCQVCQCDLEVPEVVQRPGAKMKGEGDLTKQDKNEKGSIPNKEPGTSELRTESKGRKRKLRQSSSNLSNNEVELSERLRKARVVWTKFGSYPWWPSRYLSTEELQDEIATLKESAKNASSLKEKKTANQKTRDLESLISKSKKTNQVLVRFYAGASLALVSPDKIKPFEKHFKQYASNTHVWGKKFKPADDGALIPASGSPMAEAQEVRFSYCMKCDKVIPEDEENAVGCNNCQAWTHISCAKQKLAPGDDEDFYCSVCQQDLNVDEVVSNKRTKPDKKIENENENENEAEMKQRFIVRINKESQVCFSGLDTEGKNIQNAEKEKVDDSFVVKMDSNENMANEKLVEGKINDDAMNDKRNIIKDKQITPEQFPKKPKRMSARNMSKDKKIATLLEGIGTKNAALSSEEKKLADRKIKNEEVKEENMDSVSSSNVLTEVHRSGDRKNIIKEVDNKPEPVTVKTETTTAVVAGKTDPEIPINASVRVNEENQTNADHNIMTKHENNDVKEPEVNGTKNQAVIRKVEEVANTEDKNKQSNDFVSKRLLESRVVWAKTKGNPWWPSKCVSKKELTDEISSLYVFLKTEEDRQQKIDIENRIEELEKLKNSNNNDDKNQILIRFYGKEFWAYVPPESIKPFEKYFKQYASDPLVWGKEFEVDEEGDIGWPAYGSPMAKAQEVRCSRCMLCDRHIPEEEMKVISCHNCLAWTYINCAKGKQLPQDHETFYCVVCQKDLNLPEVVDMRDDNGKMENTTENNNINIHESEHIQKKNKKQKLQNGGKI